MARQTRYLRAIPVAAITLLLAGCALVPGHEARVDASVEEAVLEAVDGAAEVEVSHATDGLSAELYIFVSMDGDQVPAAQVSSTIAAVADSLPGRIDGVHLIFISGVDGEDISVADQVTELSIPAEFHSDGQLNLPASWLDGGVYETPGPITWTTVP